MFSLARGAISSPSIPGSLPATPRLKSSSSHFLAGPCFASTVSEKNNAIQLLSTVSLLTQDNEKKSWLPQYFTHLPGKILCHAILYHLFKSRCAIDSQGPFDRCGDFHHIHGINGVALKNQKIGYVVIRREKVLEMDRERKQNYTRQVTYIDVERPHLKSGETFFDSID